MNKKRLVQGSGFPTGEITYKNKRENMKDIIVLLIFVGLWYLLQAYILPKLGIST
ncbi:MAG: hypothetical protein WB792_13455 [Desulfobacterales bacterium]